MKVIEWSDEYKTGNSDVDRQHQNLFTLVNQLHVDILANKNKEIVYPVLEKLGQYTIEHFQTEEKMMFEMNYPDVQEHKKNHDLLVTRTLEILEGYKKGTIVLPLTLSQFLRNWLHHHIKGDDFKLVKWIQAQKDKA